MSGSQTTSPGETTGILGTREGKSILISNQPGAREGQEASGGRIYTDADMLTLEQVFKNLGVVTAVMEKPVPIVAGDAVDYPFVADAIVAADSASAGKGEARRVSYPLILALGGIPAATFAVGTAMLIAALVGGSAMSNAYIGLLLFFGGIGLGVTARAAIRPESQG